MSEKPQDWDKSRDEIISGEYVLGVLSDADRKRVEARIMTDPKFAMQVRRWQDNLADFNEDYESVRPPSNAFPRLEAELFRSAKDNSHSFWQGLWGSLLLWRSLSVATLAVLIAVALGARLPNMAGSVTPSRALVAELVGMDAPVNLVASYDMNSGRLSVLPAALQQTKPQSLEVWVIEDGKPPLSVGVLPEKGQGEIVVAQMLRQHFSEGKTIAITIEPLGGSASGKPTGPVIAAGKAQLL